MQLSFYHIFKLSKLKACAGNKIIVTQKLKLGMGRTEDIILCFSCIVFKGLFSKGHQKLGFCGKGLWIMPHYFFSF